jgi:hypothetical protein
MLGTDPLAPERLSDVFQSIGDDSVTVAGYAPYVLLREASLTQFDSESFRHNRALIGKAVRVMLPELGDLTLTFTLDASVKNAAVFRMTDEGTALLNAAQSGTLLSVPLTENGVYFVADLQKLYGVVEPDGAMSQGAANTVLLDDFHFVTLNAPLTAGSDTDTDGDGVPDCEELTAPYTIDLGNGRTATVYGFRSDPTLPDTDFDGIPDQYDNAPYNNVFTGKLKSGHDDVTSVSFTVDYRSFFTDNTTYQPGLATYSVMGAALAYFDVSSAYDNAYLTLDAEQTWQNGTISASKKLNGVEVMQLFGFEDVVDYKLGSNGYHDDDLCEAIFGHRTVTYNGQTKVVVAIWVRGTDAVSEEEWSSNFHMGRLNGFFDPYDSVSGKDPRQSNDDWTRKTNHRGFDVCATRILNYYKNTYYPTCVKPVLDANPTYTLTHWLTGHSRGAAVGNLIASYLIDEGRHVFAYTFASPNNTANTEASAAKYDCIFNLVNSNDFVPMLPMVEWGFTRYGKTAFVDASAYASEIKTATGATYSGNFISSSDMSTLLGKFICITGENANRNNPGKILGWREVYTFHCGDSHAGEDNGNYQSTTFCEKAGILNWNGPTESGYNGYGRHLRKYSYWNDGICETPAYCLQVLVELLVKVAQGETVGGASTYITRNKLADKFDFDKWSLISYATKLTEPHFMDTYSVIQTQINAAGDPGSLFATLRYYTATDTNGGRPAHTHTYTYVPYEGQEPTCEGTGLGYRYCLCSNANTDYYDDYQKNVTIPALGHDWGAPTWSWTGTTAATATFVCSRNASHVEVLNANVVSATGTGADAGYMVYTATVEHDGVTYTDTVREPMAAFYLIGSPNGWTLTESFVFTPFGSNGEYVMQTTLNEGDEIKVAYGTAGMTSTQIANENWYPGSAHSMNGTGNYVVDADHAGAVTIYFNPNGNSAWWSFGGYIYIAKDHSIEVQIPNGHGTARTIDDDGLAIATASVGRQITVETTPDAGWTLERIELWKTHGGTAVQDTLTGASFLMPDYDTVVKVYYKAIPYTVTWRNWDGEELSTDTVYYGDTPVYGGETPARPMTDQYTYSFSGWTPEIVPVTGDATYTATFEATTRTYPVTFKNWDGEILRVVETAYGVTPAWTGEPPTRPADAQYTYVFDHWEPALAAVTGPATYTAVYVQDNREFDGPVWNWTGVESATATFTAKDDPTYSEAVDALITSTVTTEPGCETEGVRTYTATALFHGQTYDDTKTAPVPAVGHDWSAPTYEWAADNSTVTAKRVCANDPSHVETETVDVAVQVTDATCETAGSKTYTATFANEAFETQTKTEEIPAAGHKPGEPVEENRVEATCLTDGGYDTVVYCTVCHKELSREHTVLPATGHAWGEPTYEWAADNSTVTAKRVCANDPTHIESETVDTSYEVTKPATTEEEGTGLYTATFENEAFETQTKEIVLPKITKLATEIRINEADVEYKGTTPYVVWNHVRHEPGFTVVAEDGTVLTEADYTYEYRENDKPGTGYIFVTVTNEAYADPNYAYFKIYLEPTEWMTIANVSDGIRLEWAPVQDAAGYVIYRRAWNLVDGGWTTFERWDNTTETTWLDGHDDAHKVYAGTRYQYGVKAYFTRRTDPVINQQIGGNVGDNYNLGLVGPLKTTVRITTRTLKSVTPGTKQLTVKWGGSKVFTGYQIKYATDENFTKGVRSIKIDDPSTTQKVITGLLSGKTYYVMVRSYQEFEGMTYFGEWSNVLSAQVK